jgi:site-specific recombinase
MYHWLYSYWNNFSSKRDEKTKEPVILPTLEEVITHQQAQDYTQHVIIEVRGGFVSSSPARAQENTPT